MQRKTNRTNNKIYNSKHSFYFQSNLLVGDRGVTCTCTSIWCCPTAHKYQAVSLSCSFFRVTLKVPILSSLIASEESSKLPSASVSRQELQSPFRHHFFTLCLSTGSHRGSQWGMTVHHGGDWSSQEQNNPSLRLYAPRMFNKWGFWDVWGQIGSCKIPVFLTVSAFNCDAAPLLADQMVLLDWQTCKSK